MSRLPLRRRVPARRSRHIHPRLVDRDVERERSPRVGERLGNYYLCAEIARGGMATVYLAREISGLRRLVAVKCIRDGRATDPRFLERFVEEAEIAARVQHPNICSALEFGHEDGMFFLVLEYLRGASLSAMFQRIAALEVDEGYRNALIARLLIDACEGLQAVHQQDIVHRDISPSNLFITTHGCLKLLDFGIAASCEDGEPPRISPVDGKLDYLAPELLEGGHASARSDIFSLGVVAWELLTGEPMAEACLDDAAISEPSRHRQGVSRLLDAITMRALDSDPSRRFASARQMGRELRRFLVDTRQAVGWPEVAEALAIDDGPDGPPARRDTAPDHERPTTLAELEPTTCRSEPRDGPTRLAPVVIPSRARRPAPRSSFRQLCTTYSDAFGGPWARAGALLIAATTLALTGVAVGSERRPGPEQLRAPAPSAASATSPQRLTRVSAAAPESPVPELATEHIPARRIREGALARRSPADPIALPAETLRVPGRHLSGIAELSRSAPGLISRRDSLRWNLRPPPRDLW